jgi:membrane protease YdiL (CAAX protease family)
VTPRRLWLTIGANCVGAVATLVLVDPPSARPWPLPVAAAVGAVGGLVLFAALARRRPCLPRSAALTAVLLAAAAAEEVVWRRLLLGELDRHGPVVAALALSTGAFALAHRRGRRSHLVTGAAFGLLFLASGIVAACCAHGAYNLSAAGARGRP